MISQTRFSSQADVEGIQPKTMLQFDLTDGRQRGLCLRVSYGGTKTYFVAYRFHGHQRRITLGHHPHLKLKDARSEANTILAMVDRGEDPAAQKIRKRQTEKSNTLSGAVVDYINNYAKPNTRSWQTTQRILEANFVSRWRSISLRSIDKSMVRDALEDIASNGHPSAANKALAIIRKFFNWCVEEDRCPSSPCNGLRMPAKLKSRQRVLSEQEIRSVLTSAKSLGYPFGHMVTLMFLTAQRRSEVAGITESEINFQSALWKLAPERTKSNRSHVVPLMPSAAAIIADCCRVSRPLLFPARGRSNRPVSGFSKWKQQLDRSSGVRDWCLHDIRRTVSTGLGELEVLPHVIDRVLNHSTGKIGGLAKTYNCYEYVSECRAALKLWENYLTNLIGCELVFTENTNTNSSLKFFEYSY
ncbi:MAG: hypothetical protein CTY31_06255 [Hyphomicrobium sp.]|nr:MAG: hypothetical protein CTY31_06255 [Hyphomicrobium sp.]